MYILEHSLFNIKFLCVFLYLYCHIHYSIAIKSSGTSASGVTFQAYLIEGLARWNMQRSEDSRVGVEKVPRSFDISLKHRLNALSTSVHNEPALPSFCTPPACTQELIGMSHLRSLNGDLPGDVQGN